MAFLDTRHQKKSFSLTTFLLSALVLVLFYIGFTYMDPPEEKGIAVNLGTMDFGSGNRQPLQPIRSEPMDIPRPTEEAPQEEVEQETVPEETAPSTKAPEKLLTQDNAESIRMQQQQKAKREAQARAEREARQKQEAQRRKKAEQDAKRKKLDALMGGIGKSKGTASGSEGNDNRPGDKGNPLGNPYATSYYGSPGNGSGGYGLNGRSLVNKGTVQQQCNEDGRVVVRIVVDRNGKVIKATPGVKGTTNNAPCLLEPARKTAFMHRWNVDSKAPSQQIGFVVVNFKLGQ
ncbi:MAG: cell envelope integrity protein TolA [Bacteroidota bacterium]